MDEQTWRTKQFEEHRAHLTAVAYRMLGSVGEAEDAVQEAWIRLSRADNDPVLNVGGWLTTVVGRVCLDALRARQSRREDYVGSWLPEPIVSIGPDGDPEHDALIADSIGLALLVVLENLTPPERVAFVLHDMFGVSFEELAPMLDRTPAATRKLASRARRRVQGLSPDPDPDPDLAGQREVVNAFLAASRASDFDALIAVLDPQVTFRLDSGGRGPHARPPIIGARDVARRLLEQGTRFAPFARPAIVNGTAGLVVAPGTDLIAVVGFTIVNARVAAIDLITDTAKLRRLHITAGKARA
jgi:RNA polymerase sigma factor (sigma-70 family)